MVIAFIMSWDDVPVTMMTREVIARMHQEDHVQSKWCIDGFKLDVWVDTSSLETGVSLESNGATLEDAS